MLGTSKSLSFSLLLISFIFYCTACGTLKPYYGKSYRGWETISPPDSAEIKYSVFLIGDAGTDDNNPVLQLLNKQLLVADSLISKGDSLEGTSNSVVFLGDNIYYYGLPEEDAYDREDKEALINRQMDALQGFRGRKIFIPGNHDWRASSPGGLETLNRQEIYVENYADSTIEFLPNRGCPGPLEVHMAEDLVILVIDSEWWLTPHEKPVGLENGCYVDDRFDFIVQLEDAIQRNSDKHIVIVQHHPLFSNSNHGGRYSLKDNIFPLTLVRDNLYIPLPVIGSLYPLLRKYGISRQDISNPVYQELIAEQLAVIEDLPNVVFAAGHDHNLQMRDHKEMTHIVSGSGGKVNFAARGSGSAYVHQIMGFSRLNYYNNGEVWVEFWTADEDTPEGKLTFKYPVYALKPVESEELEQLEEVSYADSSRYVVAGEEYKAGKFKRFWLGDHYRDEWTTPVKVPYLDMATEADGLTPVQKGGGNQTISLRLINEDSLQYNLRSINKNPRGAIPEPLFNTFAEDLVQDQISTAHPYGAFAIPKMASALNLFHTEPDLFYTPHTPLLGPYLNDFGGTLAMLEIRPDENLSEFARFGYSNNVVSTKTMLRHLEEDNDNVVDNAMFLSNRLFDMLVNDWDRHADQWRWSEFENEGKGSTFKPVARDRDQVFTKYDGVIPYLLSRKWAIRNFQHFDYEINDIIGLNLAARHLDRRLLTNLTKQEWISTIETIQQQLTDEIIKEAVASMPVEVYNLSGEEIIKKLIYRRDHMKAWAIAYYDILSREVDITGSDKHEFFHVTQLNDKETEVRIYKKKKDGEVKKAIYERIFSSQETKEIRIYGLNGQDSILVEGGAKNKLKIRVIGGEGEDVIIDKSRGKVLVYDNVTENNQITSAASTKLKLSSKEYINNYDPEAFEYNYLGPRLYVEYNIDDGVYLGGGLFIKRNGFRKTPKTSHLLLANYAFNIDSYNIKYEGNFYSLFGRNWDLGIDAHSFGPKYVFNYFGEGNGSSGEIEDIDYYRINMDRFQFNPAISRRFTDFFTIGVGPTFNYYNLKSNEGKIINSDDFADKYDVAQSSYFGGAKLFINLDLKDDPIDPMRGVRWLNQATYYKELGSGDAAFTNYSTDVAVYASSLLSLNLTAAIRFGASTNVGDYKFYQSQFLGGSTNLRGFRNYRFAGRTAVFNNTELRLRLFDIRNYIFNGSYGIIGFVDSGRVWSDVANEQDKWHRAYGPGVWINFYKLFLVSGTVGFSDEGTYFNLNFGHFF